MTIDDVRPGKLGFKSPAAGAAHLFAKLWMVEQGFEFCGQVVHVAWLKEQAGPFTDRVRESSNAAGHDRPTDRHRLDSGPSQCFLGDGGKGQNVTAAQVRRKLLLGQPADKSREVIDLSRWIAGGNQFKVMPFLPKSLARLVQDLKTLDALFDKSREKNAATIRRGTVGFAGPRPGESGRVKT